MKVYKITAAIPSGKVATYGQLAAILGIPMAARAVGTALRNTPPGLDIPCHRVVNKSGAMATVGAFGSAENQRRLLEEEGIGFKSNGTIDMKRHLWKI